MTNEANVIIQALNSMDLNLFYWFYGIMPQTFGAIIAAIGMVAVYKLTDQREKNRTYAINYFGFCETRGHKGAGEREMMIEQAIKHCQNVISQTEKETESGKATIREFEKWRENLEILLAERKDIIGHFMLVLILCFIMIVIPMIFLALKIFNWIAMFSLLIGAIITIVITCFNLTVILLTDKIPAS